MSSDVDVVIIGAGAAGLSAAKEAEQRSLSFKLLEASNRIGGRAYSEEISPGVPFDHGCAWLHEAETNPFAPIADKLGITLGREFGDSLQEGGCHLWRNGRARSPEEAHAYWRYASACEEAAERVIAEGRDVPISDIMDLESDEAALYHFNIAVIGGRDTDVTSVADYWAPGDGSDWPVQEGYGSLVARWAEDVEVSLDTRVERINSSGKRGNRIRVETSRGEVQARAVLITTSTGVLAAGDIDFEPGLPSWKTDAIHALPMGPVNKIGVHFDRDVWGPDQRGTHFGDGTESELACLDLNVFGFPVGVVFTGGRFAAALEQEGQRASEDYGIARLADVLGNDIKRHITRTIATAWLGNPFTHGGYSSALPGQAHQRKELARSIDQRLFFAGEATMEHSQATCHGAYLSGIRAMGEIAAELSSPA